MIMMMVVELFENNHLISVDAMDAYSLSMLAEVLGVAQQVLNDSYRIDWNFERKHSLKMMMMMMDFVCDLMERNSFE